MVPHLKLCGATVGRSNFVRGPSLFQLLRRRAVEQDHPSKIRLLVSRRASQKIRRRCSPAAACNDWPQAVPMCRPWRNSALPDSKFSPGVAWQRPAGTPEAVVARWNELANAALRDPKLRDQVSTLDYEVRGGTAKEFAEFVLLDISRYKRLAEDMGLPED